MIQTRELARLFPNAQMKSATPVSEFGPSSQSPIDESDGALTIATFLFARVNQFAAICQAMSAEEAASFVNEIRRMLTNAVTSLGGEIAQRRPDSILAV